MRKCQPSLVITIDGPAASGKGTIADLLAQKYNLVHLDTGLIYRNLAHQLIEHNLPLDASPDAISLAKNLDLSLADPSYLKSNELGIAASKIAIYPEIRTVLVEKQRAYAKSSQGCVLDGRDTGTVIFPDADIKFFVTADINERAKRRYKQLKKSQFSISLAQVLDDLNQRDDRDAHRKYSPLRMGEDAYLLDTTKKSISQVLAEAEKHIYSCYFSKK